MPDLTPERLAELSRIAEAATPGPWAVNPFKALVDEMATLTPVCAMLWPTDLRTEEQTLANAQHIATFDPTTVVALLDEMERLRQQNATLRSALAELVTLKDEVKHRAPADYERRKPQAWQAAREALERVQETGVLLTGEECLILSFGLTDPYLLDDLTDEAWDRYRALYKRIVWIEPKRRVIARAKEVLGDDTGGATHA